MMDDLKTPGAAEAEFDWARVELEAAMQRVRRSWLVVSFVLFWAGWGAGALTAHWMR